MAYVREVFRPQLMDVNATYNIAGTSMGGFLAKTGGTLTVTDADGTVFVNATPVTAGIYTPMPFMFNTSAGATVALAGGASGTLAV